MSDMMIDTTIDVSAVSQAQGTASTQTKASKQFQAPAHEVMHMMNRALNTLPPGQWPRWAQDLMADLEANHRKAGQGVVQMVFATAEAS